MRPNPIGTPFQFSLIFMVLAGCQSVSREASDVKIIGGVVAENNEILRGLVFLGKRCSAVKVGKFHFLTAAHCDSPDLRAGQQLEVHFGLLKDDPSKIARVKISKFKVHPDYVRKLDQSYLDEFDVVSDSTYDLAILESENETPEISEAALNYLTLSAGDPVTLSGFGDETDELTNGSTSEQPPVRRKKYQVTKIDKVNRNMFMVDRFSSQGEEGRLARGDSGGPVYLAKAVESDSSVAADFSQVVGINSYKAPTAGIFSAAVRLDKEEVRTWIEAILSGSREPEGLPPGSLANIDWANLALMECEGSEVSVMIKRTPMGFKLTAATTAGVKIYDSVPVGIQILDSLPYPSALFNKLPPAGGVGFRAYGTGRLGILHYRDGLVRKLPVVENCQYEIEE